MAEIRAQWALTPRSRQVLSLAAMGFTDKEIAVRLAIRVRTVRFHFAQSCRALRARTRMQAIAVAAVDGLIDTPHMETPRN